MVWQAEGYGLTNPTHTYSSPGLYIVTLRVTYESLEGIAESYSQIGTNLIADANGPYDGAVSVPIEFDGRATTGRPHGEVWFNWEFGDGAHDPRCGIYASNGTTPITELDFGQMQINQPAGTYTDTFIIKNEGNTILNISIECNGILIMCDMINIAPVNFTLGPAEQQEVAVDFIPTELGALGAVFVIGDICPNLLIHGTGIPEENPDPECLIVGYPGTDDIIIDLGQVPVGSTSFAYITIMNNGGGTMEGEVSKLSGSDNMTIATSPTTYSLTGGETKDYTFQYTPLSAGSNDEAMFDLGISCGQRLIVRGESVNPGQAVCYLPQGNTISFGNIVIGSTVDRSFMIANTGGSTLTGTLTPTCSAASGFKLEGSNSQPIDFSIEPGTDESYTVSFTPTTEGYRSCTVEVTDNAPPDDKCGNIELTGTGYEGGSGDDPPYCPAGDLVLQPKIYDSGFFGPKNDANNRHGAMRADEPMSTNFHFTTISDNEGQMKYNCNGAWYFGEEHLADGTITFGMKITTDPNIPDHPNGTVVRNYAFLFADTCCNCANTGSWHGGRNMGGQHYFNIWNGNLHLTDPYQTRFDFNTPGFGSLRVVCANKGPESFTQTPKTYNIPEMQPDSWVNFTLTWHMWYTSSANKYDRVDLTITTDQSSSTKTWELIPGSCGVGRIFTIGSVDRSNWNEAHTGIMHPFTNCEGDNSCPTTNPECNASSDRAPFPGIRFRSIKLPAIA